MNKMPEFDKDIFKSCFESNVYRPEDARDKKELIATVQRSEEVFIQLPEDCGFQCGEKVNVQCYENGNIQISKLVPVEIDLDDDVILELALIAHERDITLNELICEALRQAIKD